MQVDGRGIVRLVVEESLLSEASRAGPPSVEAPYLRFKDRKDAGSADYDGSNRGCFEGNGAARITTGNRQRTSMHTAHCVLAGPEVPNLDRPKPYFRRRTQKESAENPGDLSGRRDFTPAFPRTR